MDTLDSRYKFVNFGAKNTRACKIAEHEWTGAYTWGREKVLGASRLLSQIEEHEWTGAYKWEKGSWGRAGCSFGVRGEISISAGFAPNLLLGSKFNPRTSTLNPEACTLNVRGGAPFPMNAPQPVSGVGNYARNSLGKGAYWQITKIGDTVPTPKLPSLCRGQRWNQEGNVQ